MKPTTRSHLVVRQGLLFGVVLGLVDSLRTLIEGPTGLTAPAPGALGLVAFLIVAAGFVYLGARIGSAVGRIGASALSGLIAGLVVWGFYVIAALAVALPNQDTLRRQLQAAADQAHVRIQYSTSGALGAVVFALVLAIFLGAGVGAALGALGGVVGRRSRGAVMAHVLPGRPQ
jgi:hypothetical protein